MIALRISVGSFGFPAGWNSGAKHHRTHFREPDEQRIHIVTRGDGTRRHKLPGMAGPDSCFRGGSCSDPTSHLSWLSTLAAPPSSAASLAVTRPLPDATTIRKHVLCRNAVKACPQPAPAPGSWHLRGSRAWPGPIGGWHAITRTLPCNLRTILAAIGRLPFRARRKLSFPNRFICQPPGMDGACTLAGA